MRRHRRGVEITRYARGHRRERISSIVSRTDFLNPSLTTLLLIFFFSLCPVADAAGLVSDGIEEGAESYVRRNKLGVGGASRSRRSYTHHSLFHSEQQSSHMELSSLPLLSEDKLFAAEEKEGTTPTVTRKMRYTTERGARATNDDKKFPISFVLDNRAEGSLETKLSAKEIAAHLRALRRMNIVLQFDICIEEGIGLLEIDPSDDGVLQTILKSADTILNNYVNSSQRLRRLESVWDEMHKRNVPEVNASLRGSPVQDHITDVVHDDDENDIVKRRLSTLNDSVFYTNFVAPAIDNVIDLAAFNNSKIMRGAAESSNCKPNLIQAKIAVFVNYDYSKEERAAITHDIVEEFGQFLPTLVLY